MSYRQQHPEQTRGRNPVDSPPPYTAPPSRSVPSFKSAVQSQRPARSQSRSPNRNRKQPANSDRDGSTRTLPACALCLSRRPHNLRECKVTRTWDGKPTRCTRDARGRLINPDSRTICLDWQRLPHCARTDHEGKHECSGCGWKDHGAQDCHLTEPISSQK
jgi:hypothetical protein